MLHGLRASFNPQVDLSLLALTKLVQVREKMSKVRRDTLVIVDTWRQKGIDRSVLSNLRWEMKLPSKFSLKQHYLHQTHSKDRAKATSDALCVWLCSRWQHLPDPVTKFGEINKRCWFSNNRFLHGICCLASRCFLYQSTSIMSSVSIISLISEQPHRTPLLFLLTAS